MSRPVATAITFLISALAHELVMGCITRKFRGYGFFAMMLQMPIVVVQRSKWVRGRTLLNNVLFWCSMILGLSMVSSATLEVLLDANKCHRCALCTFLYRLGMQILCFTVERLIWEIPFLYYAFVWNGRCC